MATVYITNPNTNELQLLSNQAKRKLSLVLAPLVDWELFIVRTETGRILTSLTLKQAKLSFDEWAFQERTGVDMLNWTTKTGQTRAIPWLNIIKACGYTSASEVDAKFWTKLEKDLEGFKPPQKPGSKVLVEMDKDFSATASAALHTIFDSHANASQALSLDMVAAFLIGDQTIKITDLEQIKDQVKAFVKAHPMMFSIGQGPAPKVVRLQLKNKKATGAKAVSSERSPKGSKPAKIFKKYSAALKDAGITQQDYMATKAVLGADPTLKECIEHMMHKSDANED